MRHNMKRAAALLLAFVLLLALAGCGAEKPNVKEPLDATAAWLLENVPEPGVGTVGGDWLVFGLARAETEVPEGYFDSYYETLTAYTTELGGVLHEKKYTEYSRTVLALTAIGKDPTDVGGYDLLAPLADYEQTVFQGVNGAIFALLALDSGDYAIPTCAEGRVQATREMYVDHILSKEISTGGWSLAGGEAEADMTAMALQALANYQDREDVADAIERGLTALSDMQDADGGFTSEDTQSSESVAQSIVALTELGISIDDDRFVKNGNTLLDRLLEYQAEDGGFSHEPDSEVDLMATEQAFYALAALHRAEQGMTTLYTMTDVES